MAILEIILTEPGGRIAQKLPRDMSLHEMKWRALLASFSGTKRAIANQAAAALVVSSIADLAFMQNASKLFDFYSEYGRQVVRDCDDPDEAKLAVWLNRARGQAASSARHRAFLEIFLPWWKTVVNDAFWFQKEVQENISAQGPTAAIEKYRSLWSGLGQKERKYIQGVLPDAVPPTRQEKQVKRAEEIVVWSLENGRLPVNGLSGKSKRERNLASSLWKFRKLTRAGELDEAVSQVISETFPEWLVVRKTEDWFRARLEELREYHEAHGRWPRIVGAEDDEEKRLGIWLQNQRVAQAGRSNYSWTADREAALDELCPGWVGGERKSWSDRLEELSRFQITHQRRPRGKGDEKSLDLWLANQKRAFRDGRLSGEQVEALERECPGYLSSNASGEERYAKRVAELKDYYDEYGRWPRYGAESEDERKLASWLASQRTARKGNGSSIWSVERESMLDEACPGWTDARRGSSKNS